MVEDTDEETQDEEEDEYVLAYFKDQIIKDTDEETQDEEGDEIHMNIKLASYVGDNLISKIKPIEAAMGYFTLLSNAYASADRWVDVANVGQKMLEMGVKKPPGHNYPGIAVWVGITASERSMEKRIIPRWTVLQGLLSKGLLIKNKLNIGSSLKVSDSSFIKLYMIKYEKEAPELLNVYKKVMPYGTGCKASLSNFEANSNYKIADVVGAFLMMDMAHISGLVVASVVANSFEYYDVVTTKHTRTLFIVGILHKSELESAICFSKCGEWQNLRSKSMTRLGKPATNSHANYRFNQRYNYRFRRCDHRAGYLVGRLVFWGDLWSPNHPPSAATVPYHPPRKHGPPLQPRQSIIGMGKMGREDQGYWGGSGDHGDNNMCFEDRWLPKKAKRGGEDGLRGGHLSLQKVLCPRPSESAEHKEDVTETESHQEAPDREGMLPTDIV
ncbi:hypothetical protein GIB67_004769 [Kingdonia uniflora]|uniref:Serine hydroxymethyltransferase-like domain-containing protein n=1 Tax=Kingdonia uniflora TaxID=39325 RepID=A0A7J7NRD9_9MAGN|nr:hypothetical protein GIB67_004769 [Kingdonia uniflora]